jgi:uncharacterized membrane protein YgcG
VAIAIVSRWSAQEAYSVPNVGPRHWCLSESDANNDSRMSWEFYHALQRSPEMPAVARCPGAETKACNFTTNRPLMFWSSTFSRAAMVAAKSERQWSLRKGSAFADVSQLTVTAFRMLRTSLWCLIPRDKGCGYVAHKRVQVGIARERVLGGIECREISPNGINLPILKSHCSSSSGSGSSNSRSSSRRNSTSGSRSSSSSSSSSSRE